eukprot:COSAG02_NODE_228_length_28131_cov_25.387093_2_plen_444_part_00
MTVRPCLKEALAVAFLASSCCGWLPHAVHAGSCTWEWETTQTDPDANDEAQTIDFLDSGKVAAGFTIAAKFEPTRTDVSATDMGIVSQCSCKCGTSPENPPAHSGMLVGLKKIGSSTGLVLAFLGPGATGDSSWLLGPEVPTDTLSETEVSFTPDADAATGTIRLSVGSTTKTFAKQKSPGGFGPYHYPWRVGWQGGGGKKCRDHAGEQLYDCGQGCNQFKGTFDYAALCTGHCKPGECLAQAAAEASSTGVLLVLLLWCAGTAYAGGGVALGRRNGRATTPAVARSSKGAAVARLLGAHPHWSRWVECAALVEDGVAFSIARLRGNASSRMAVGYTPVRPASSLKVDKKSSSESRPSKSGSRSENRSRRGGTSRGQQSLRKERKGRENATSVAQDASSGLVGENMQAEREQEEERILHEKRSAGVHSSQQAIKVVGLGGVPS